MENPQTPMAELSPPSGNFLSRLFDRLDRTVEWMVIIIFLIMLMVGGLQVIMRKIFNHSLAWSEELQIFCHIWLVMMTLAIAYRKNEHLGMMLLVGYLPQSVQKGLAILTDTMWLVLAFAMVFFTAFYITPTGKTFLEIAAHNRSAGLGIPYCWIYLCLVLGGCYLFLTALKKLCHHIVNPPDAATAIQGREG